MFCCCGAVVVGALAVNCLRVGDGLVGLIWCLCLIFCGLFVIAVDLLLLVAAVVWVYDGAWFAVGYDVFVGGATL